MGVNQLTLEKDSNGHWPGDWTRQTLLKSGCINTASTFQTSKLEHCAARNRGRLCANPTFFSCLPLLSCSQRAGDCSRPLCLQFTRNVYREGKTRGHFEKAFGKRHASEVASNVKVAFFKFVGSLFLVERGLLCGHHLWLLPIKTFEK